MTGAVQVRDAAELAQAVTDGATLIEVDGEIAGSPMITLPPGTTLRAAHCVSPPAGSA